MITINYIITKIFDFFFLPMVNLAPEWPLFAISIVTGVFMLFIFRLTSNQKGIKETKQKIKGLFLEIRLYQDDLKQSLTAQKAILRTNVTYMKYSFVPMLVMIGPVILILIQMNFRFSYRPFVISEPINVKIIAAPSLLSLDQVILTVQKGVNLETKPLRIPLKGEIDWRLRATETGNYNLRFSIGEKKVIHPLHVSTSLVRVYPEVMKPDFLAAWLYPGAPFIPQDSPISEIHVSYPERSTPIVGLDMHWLISFFILSIIGGYALKKPFGVEI